MKKDKICGIYKITNPNNRVYIGQSKDIYHRFSQYKKLYSNTQNQRRLYRSFVKHGYINHVFEIIEKCDINDLNDRERHWQEFYSSCDKNGMNCVYTNSKLFPKTKTYKWGKLIICMDTGVFYERIEDAAFSINMKYVTLRGQLCGRSKNKTSLRYVDDPYIGVIEKSKQEKKSEREKKLRSLMTFPPLVVYNIPSHYFGFKWDHKETIHVVMKHFLNAKAIREYDFNSDNGRNFYYFMKSRYKGTALLDYYENFIQVEPKRIIPKLLINNKYND